MRILGGLLLAAFAGGAIFAGAACGGGTSDTADSSSAAPQQSVDELTARVQQDEVLNAWITLQANNPHELDTALQNGTIDGEYVPTLRTLIRVLALTDWPNDLRADATKLHDDAVTLYQGLNAGKTADELKGASATMHDDYHEFTPKAGDWAAKDLPADAGGPSGEDHGSSTTPMAGTTMTSGH